jgi:hypothetical protein
MDRNQRHREAALLIPLFGVFLILPPILGLFDGPHAVAGIPILHIYLFAVWLALVGAAFWLSRRLGRDDPDPGSEGGPSAPPPARDGQDGA